MADRRTKIILGLDVGPYVRGLATASTATSAFVKSLDSSDSRMGNLVQTSLALGPALVPIGAVAVPAVAALTAGLGAAAGAAGVAALAFNGIGEGLEALNEYQLEPSAKNLEKVRQAFEDLGPAGSNFVMFLDKLEPKIDSLQNAARAGLLPGVEEGIRSLLERAPQVERIIGNISGALGDLAAEGGEALASDKFDDFFDYIETEARPILEDMGRTLGNVTEGLANMLVGFGPAGNDFSKILLGLSRDFAEWSRGLDENDSFQEFVDYVRRVTPSALETLGSLVVALADIVEAAAPIGEVSLPIIRGLAEVLSAIADSPAGPVIIGTAAALSTLSRGIAVFNAANGAALVGTFKKSREEGTKLGKSADRLAGVFSPTGALVGGVGALALSFTDLDEKAGLSNAAMGAMLGSVAGPWGAAIGGGIGLVKDFAVANDDLEDSAKRVSDIMGGTDATGIVSSLQAQQKGAAGAADNYGTLDRSLNFVADGMRGAGPLGIAMGESLRFMSGEASNAGDSVKALVGNVTAFANLARFDSALNGGSLKSYGKDVSELEESLAKAEPVLKKFGFTVEDVLSGNLSDSEMRQLAAATRHYLKTVDSAPGRTKAMGAALKDLNDPMNTAEESASALATALDSVFTPALDADEAMQARIESLIALRKQLAKTNGEFDFQTQATRESRAAIRDHVAAIVTEAKAMAERGDGTRKISRYLREQRKELLRAFPKEARDEAKLLIDRTFRYGEIIRGLPKKAATKVEAPGVEKTIDQFTNLFGWIDKTPNKKDVKTDAPGIEPTTKKASGLAALINDTIPDKKDVNTSAPGADKAIGQFKDLDRNMRTLSDKEVALTLNANSKDVLDQVTDALTGLFADGAVLDFNANGDIKNGHVAQIAPAGRRNVRVWAEPETMGEAYIPFAPSKRERSVAIWQETGRRLGVMENANGSITLDTRANPNPNKPMRQIDNQYEEIAREFAKAASKGLNKGLKNLTVGFHWPLPRQFGPSGTWGSYDSGGDHPALDWPAPLGTPIFATLPGRVADVQHLSSSYGNHVVMNHGRGLESISAHMERTAATEGDRVMPGGVIGYVDSTGNSTGNHLHLEFRKNGVPINYTSWLHGGGPMGIGAPIGVYDGNHEGLDRASPGEAKAYAKSIMGRWGWGPFQWPYWEDLGNRESGWRWDALNESSGAYGIPQSLPASKMASSGPDWRTNAGTQLDWMAGYIKERYDGPFGAIRWHDAHNWYADGAVLMDQGGILKHGQRAVNLSGRDEAFLDPELTEVFLRFVNALEGFNKPGPDISYSPPEGIDFPEYLGLSDKEQAILDSAGEGFNIDSKSDRSEIKAEINALIGSVEEAFDGNTGGLVAVLEKFKDRALDTAKALEQEKLERDKLRDQLKATRQKANEFGDTVAGNFQNDPFSGGLDDFFLQTRADRNDAKRGNRLRKRAERLGLDGPLAKALLESGNIDLLAELVRGGKSEIRKAEKAFESRNQAANQFGNAAADQVFGHRIDKVTNALEKHTIRVDKLTQKLDGMPEQIGDKVERGSYQGVKDAADGKKKKLTGFVKEARR